MRRPPSSNIRPPCASSLTGSSWAQVVPDNPASSVRGPKRIINTGKTPVLTSAETRGLLDSMDSATLIGLRARALIGLMVYGFARVSAALAMRVADYYPQGQRSYFRLHEKGGGSI